MPAADPKKSIPLPVVMITGPYLISADRVTLDKHRLVFWATGDETIQDGTHGEVQCKEAQLHFRDGLPVVHADER